MPEVVEMLSLESRTDESEQLLVDVTEKTVSERERKTDSNVEV